MQHRELWAHRKRSKLTQADLAYILQLSDYSNICRWEQGLRSPNTEALVVYHILFDIPITSLFESTRHSLADAVRDRIIMRVEELKSLPPSFKINQRISFLNNALKRLTA